MMNNFTVYQRGHTARIYRFPTFDAGDFEPNPWNDPRSFDATADESECVEDMLGRYGFAARAWQSLGTGLSIAIRRCRGAIAIAADTDLFFIVTGAIIAADIGFLLMLVRS